MIDLSIIIVSYNTRDLLSACLKSIQAGLKDESNTSTKCISAEVIVVDSVSADGTPQMVQEQFPWVSLIEPDSNVGYSKGNNIGIDASRGRYVLLLNPDTKVIGPALAKMVVYLDAHPRVGALGPQLLNDNGTVQSSRRRFPTLWTAFFESTWLQSIAPRSMLDRYYMRDRDDAEIMAVDWVTGAAVMARREVIEQVCGLDEGFFMYSEELDWQQRIKKAGWEIIYYPKAQIVHYGGKSSDQVVAQTHIRFQNSKIRYFRKYHGKLVAFSLRVVLLANYAAQLIIEAAKGLLGHKRELRRARVKTYWQVLRSGLGDR
ncbi:MAG: glycosyltransferase family 2 protein [Anaerolineae bacterium]|nr:glycosyltransferase family 2 protein [Anaerolineae bacterium]